MVHGGRALPGDRAPGDHADDDGRRVMTTPARQSAPPSSASTGGVSPRIAQPSSTAIGGTRYVVAPALPGARALERVGPRREADRRREDAEVDGPGDRLACSRRRARARAPARTAGRRRPDEAREERHLQRARALQQRLLRDHAARVRRRGGDAQRGAPAGVDAALRRGQPDHDRARERDRAARRPACAGSPRAAAARRAPRRTPGRCSRAWRRSPRRSAARRR